ncbi:MAG: TIGR04222 domain-containing membrane protein [Armatimonadetes bacterium]|nr:TIGR04222 domain-containing membrane protein [Armatimonadota bacterium]
MARHLQHPLWNQLAAFSFDDEKAVFPYSAKLAKQQGWTPVFAQRAIEEYRRFIFLTQVCDHTVTPSKAVDEAWHLHLTYTKSYWEGLCQGVLGRPLHHNPSDGSTADEAKYREAYDQTLNSYREWFGQEPPSDVWGTRNPKPKRRLKLSPWSWVTGGALATVLAGCTGGIFEQRGPDFLQTYFVMMAVTFFVMFMLELIPPSEGGKDNTDLSPYDIAYLCQGRDAVVRTALFSLLNQKIISVKTDGSERLQVNPGPLPDLPEPERDVINILREQGPMTGNSVRFFMLDDLRPIRDRLSRRGLIKGVAGNEIKFWSKLGLGLALLAVGANKVAVGVMRDKPVSYLVVLMLLTLIALLFLVLPTGLPTSKGTALYYELREGTKFIVDENASSIAPQVLLMGVAVMGIFGFNQWVRSANVSATYPMELYWVDNIGGLGGAANPFIRPTSSSNNSSYGCSSSSCGGGGSGCGGGGCGGCGGG